MNSLRYILTVVCLAILFPCTYAYQDKNESLVASDDSVCISLLTCSPGNELYSMFGHTAIRVHNFTRNIDLTFNYGMFNYNADNFMYRFIIGETDYELGIEHSADFFSRYEQKNCEVREQILILTNGQKRRLAEMLWINWQPENRIYRYNFLYDNCTTRARDMIEASVSEGSDSVYIDYGIDDTPVTFREIIHNYTLAYPWVEFGIDLLLGSEIDKPLSMRDRMFVPSIYEHILDSAVIHNSLHSIDGVTDIKLVPVRYAGDIVETAMPLRPDVVFWLFVFVALLLVYLDMQRGKITWWFDAFIIVVQGLVGIVLTFMFCFSEHPAVDSNWLIGLFNPLPLFVIHKIIEAKRQLMLNWAVKVYDIWILAFVVYMPFIPQDFNDALLPIVVVLVSRVLSGEYVMRYGAMRVLKLK